MKFSRALTIILITFLSYGCAPTTYSNYTNSSPRIDLQNYACGKWSWNSGNNGFFGPDCYWAATCNYYQTRDVSLCQIIRPGLERGFVIYMGKNGYLSASGNYSHHPGRDTTIRVDSNKPITAADEIEGDFSASQTRALVAQMKTGQVARLAGTKWPSSPVNSTWQLEGFSSAYDFAVNWLKSKKQ